MERHEETQVERGKTIVFVHFRCANAESRQSKNGSSCKKAQGVAGVGRESW